MIAYLRPQFALHSYGITYIFRARMGQLEARDLTFAYHDDAHNAPYRLLLLLLYHPVGHISRSASYELHPCIGLFLHVGTAPHTDSHAISMRYFKPQSTSSS